MTNEVILVVPLAFQYGLPYTDHVVMGCPTEGSSGRVAKAVQLAADLTSHAYRVQFLFTGGGLQAATSNLATYNRSLAYEFAKTIPGAEQLLSLIERSDCDDWSERTDDEVKVVAAYCERHPEVTRLRLVTSPSHGSRTFSRFAAAKQTGAFRQVVELSVTAADTDPPQATVADVVVIEPSSHEPDGALDWPTLARRLIPWVRRGKTDQAKAVFERLRSVLDESV